MKSSRVFEKGRVEDKADTIRINYLVDRNSAWQLRVHWQ